MLPTPEGSAGKWKPMNKLQNKYINTIPYYI